METQKTDKNLLAEGLKTMGITLFLMFLGPLILHTGFSNSEGYCWQYQDMWVARKGH